jgi:hypothetical protein
MLRLRKKRNKGEEDLLTTRRRVGEGLGSGDGKIGTGGQRWKTTAATLN